MPQLHPLHAPAEESQAILGTLSAVRRRIFGVRALERAALGVAWGAAVALFFTAARLLEARVNELAFLLALLPALAAASLWWKRPTARPNGIARGRLLPIAAALTVALAILMAAITRGAFGAPVPVWMVPTLTVLIFAAAGGISTPHVELKDAAIFVDRQAGFEEKVATALEMLDRPVSSELEAAFVLPVMAAAAAACRQVKTKRVRYQRMDRRVYAAAATVAIAAGALAFFSPLPAVARTQRRLAASHPPVQIRQLQDVLKELEKKKIPDEDAKAQALKPIQTAIQKLQQGNMSPIETSAVLDEAKDALKKEQDPLAAADTVEKMLKDMEGMKDFAKAGEKLAQAQSGEKTDGAADAQQALNDAVKQLADKVASGGMSATDKKSLADGLRQAAAQAAADPKLQQELKDAAGAAENGDGQAMARNLQAAGEHISRQEANRQASQDAIKQAMDQIDRMQGSGGQGSQSTMANAGENSAGQGGQQGQNGQGNPPGNSSADASNGQQNSGQQGSQHGSQQGSQNGSQTAGGAAANGGGQQQSEDPSSGSTMFEQRGGPGDHSMGRPLGGRETFVRIYDEKKTQTAGSTEKVGSRINPLAGPANGSMDVMGRADDPNSTVRNYADELPAARQRAMDELSRQEIPQQYRDMVKAFYEK